MRVIEDILLSEREAGVRARVRDVLLVRNEPGMGRVVK